MYPAEASLDPEQAACKAELDHLLEAAVLNLPEPLRAVVVLRDIEELSTSDTAAALDITEDNAKVRLHRGRTLLQDWLVTRVGSNARNAFPFMGERCDRVVQNVFAMLAESPNGESQFGNCFGLVDSNSP